MRADVIIYDGVDELDALGPYEVLALAARNGADVAVRLVTLEPRDEVVGDHGARIRPHGVLDAAPDILVVPGGGWNDRRSLLGARSEVERGDLPRAIAERHGGGALVASVCTGGMLVGSSGILAGRRAVTHRAARAQLERMGARIVDARVVDDGDIVTSGGVTSGIDMALWLVERFFGASMAAQIATDIEHERVRGVAPA